MKTICPKCGDPKFLHAGIDHSICTKLRPKYIPQSFGIHMTKEYYEYVDQIIEDYSKKASESEKKARIIFNCFIIFFLCFFAYLIAIIFYRYL